MSLATLQRARDVARTKDVLTQQQAEEMLAQLARYFDVPTPKLNWSTRVRNGRAWGLYNKINAGPNCWRGCTNSLLHEFAHILQARRAIRNLDNNGYGHGRDFIKALFDTVEFWFNGDQTRYGWLSEYRSIARYALRNVAGVSQTNRLTITTPSTMIENDKEGDSMTEAVQTETTYTLVDISNLETICFLHRAPLRNILAFQKIYEGEGKQTKRLDLLHDKESLQYLYFNTTQKAPPEDVSALESLLYDESNKLAIDETSLEVLKERIPEELRKSAGQTEGGINYMGQGSQVEGALDKGTAPAEKKEKKTGKTDEQKAAEKLAKETAKAEAKAKREADKEAKKAAKASSPKADPAEFTVRRNAAFSAIGEGEAAKALITSKVQAALAAEVADEKGKKDSESAKNYTVQIGDATPGLKWAVHQATGLPTIEFATAHAIRFMQKLGFTVLQGGAPLAVPTPKAPKEEAPATPPVTTEATQEVAAA